MFVLASTGIEVPSFESIILMIIAFAVVIGSIVTIMNGLSSMKLKNKQFIASIVNESLSVCNKETESKIDNAIIASQNLTNQKIDILSGKVEQFIRADETYKKEKDQELLSIITLLKNANIEVYKNDIRKVFYKLRESGDITDYDKEYVDSVFPIYKALGGNSDIAAKYKEICDFHQELTRENFEKARNNKKKTKKQVEEKVEEKVEEE
jgi:hypothetical protein